MYSIRFQESIFSAKLKLSRFSWSFFGGPLSATATAHGDEESVAQLFLSIGSPVEIVDKHGNLVWWGRVQKVEAFGLSASLDDISNSIKVVFKDRLGVATQTEWVSDDESIDLFGLRQHQISSITQTLDEANREALLQLKKRKEKRIQVSLGGSTDKATISFSGYYKEAEYIFYKWPNQFFVENGEGKSTRYIKIGQEPYTAIANIKDNAVLLYDEDPPFFYNGEPIGITRHSNPSDSGVFEVQGVATQKNGLSLTINNELPFKDLSLLVESNGSIQKIGQSAYQSNITFEDKSQNFIYQGSENAQVTHLKGEMIWITGSSLPDNNGLKTVVIESDHELNRFGVAEDIDDIQQVATITPDGDQVRQLVIFSKETLIYCIKIKAGKIGKPADSLVCALIIDGAIALTSEVSAQSMSSESSWIEFSFAPQLVSPGHHYFQLSRSGANNKEDAYFVEIRRAAGLNDLLVNTVGTGWREKGRGLEDKYSVSYQIPILEEITLTSKERSVRQAFEVIDPWHIGNVLVKVKKTEQHTGFNKLIFKVIKEDQVIATGEVSSEWMSVDGDWIEFDLSSNVELSPGAYDIEILVDTLHPREFFLVSASEVKQLDAIKVYTGTGVSLYDNNLIFRIIGRVNCQDLLKDCARFLNKSKKGSLVDLSELSVASKNTLMMPPSDDHSTVTDILTGIMNQFSDEGDSVRVWLRISSERRVSIGESPDSPTYKYDPQKKKLSPIIGAMAACATGWIQLDIPISLRPYLTKTGVLPSLFVEVAEIIADGSWRPIKSFKLFED